MTRAVPPPGPAGAHGDAAPRTVLLLAHTGRHASSYAARRAVERLAAAGVRVRVLDGEAPDLGVVPGERVQVCPADAHAAEGAELVLVLGGDGTILRAAELARRARVPLLGVNLGRVGFLAAAESQDLDAVLEQVLHRDWTVEERTTLDVVVTLDGRVLGREWALNEASVEKGARERMLEVVLEVDGRPLSRWGGDGVVCATPTGSTAYAFSAGGPVVWPTLDAVLIAPISAHALFARPLVVSPTSVVALEVLDSGAEGVLACDGRRTLPLPHRSRVEVRRGAVPVLLARTSSQPFTDVLVHKFDLPVNGWRGRAEERAADPGGGRTARPAAPVGGPT